jgi:hypothetical protein
VAVLQGWSKATMAGRAIGVGFLVAFGIAAWWGVKTLFG